MADYGYSAGYRGMTGGVLPAGYMEAATAPGRAYGAALANIGQNIKGEIAKYQARKEETQNVEQSYEYVSKLIGDTLQNDPKYAGLQDYYDKNDPRYLPPGVTPENINQYHKQVSQDRGLLEGVMVDASKFHDMPLAKKKAALGSAVMALNRFDTQRKENDANIFNNLKLREYWQNEQLRQQTGEAIKSAVGTPTTKTVTGTQEVTRPVPNVDFGQYAQGLASYLGGEVPSARTDYVTPNQYDREAYAKALEKYATAPDLAPQIADVESKLARFKADANASPRSLNVTTMVGAGFPGSSAFTPIIENKKQVSARVAEAEKQIPALEKQLSGLKEQAKLRPEMPTPEQFPLGQAEATIPSAPAPEMVQQTVPTSVQQPKSYQDMATEFRDILKKSNIPAENWNAILPTMFAAAGITQPLQIQTQVLPGGYGMAVSVPNKGVEIVPAPKVDYEKMSREINLPGFVGIAPSPKAADDFRDQYADLNETKKLVGRLIEIAKMGPLKQQLPSIKAEASGLVNSAQAALRLSVLGPGTITQADRELLDKIIANPTNIASFKSANIALLQGALDRANSSIRSKAQSLGLQINQPGEQPSGMRRMTFNPVTGIAQ